MCSPPKFDQMEKLYQPLSGIFRDSVLPVLIRSPELCDRGRRQVCSVTKQRFVAGDACHGAAGVDKVWTDRATARWRHCPQQPGRFFSYGTTCRVAALQRMYLDTANVVGFGSSC
jgi:hypothetical protein